MVTHQASIFPNCHEADRKPGTAIGNGTTILSMTAPGACIEKDVVAAAHLALASNGYAAAIQDAHPESYGFFASFPSLLDTKASLDEIAYGLDILGADGVLLFTRYGKHTITSNTRIPSPYGKS